MKVWILKEDGSIEFEYNVPKGALDEYLYPSMPYTDKKPPAVSDNKIAVYEDGKWVIKNDFRGVQYWIGSESFVIDVIGESVPEGSSLIPPNSPPSKQELLNSITVTTQSGKTFDGNETARSDMLVALTVGEWINETQTYWKMANNDTLLVTKEELQEALTLAIQAKGRIVGAIE